MMDEFWELVAARRRAAGITQQELAERAGLSVGAVRDIEQGRTKRPRPAAARRLFSALGLSEADLAPYLTRPGPEGWRFRVLGELDVSFGDRTLDPGPPKQRAVLAVLALSPNTL
ncbi:MAG TPA: helix-turn-helix domain-containing protein, partial [Amycolatopsis sp.]|nr:helix-turn-helix domain-containing protein [Amycolatopsis sp.]